MKAAYFCVDRKTCNRYCIGKNGYHVDIQDPPRSLLFDCPRPSGPVIFQEADTLKLVQSIFGRNDEG